MTVTVQAMPSLRPRRGSLRAVAEEIERTTGLQVEIIGGTILMAPTRRGMHAGVLLMLEEMIRPKLPKHLVAVEMVSVELPGDADDYATPDLTVAPAEFMRSDEWLLDPQDVELAVEVISKSEKAKDISGKAQWYALAGVRLLLVIDPRDGSWTFYSHPRMGSYQGVLRGEYGEPIELPEPMSLIVETSELPKYGD